MTFHNHILISTKNSEIKLKKIDTNNLNEDDDDGGGGGGGGDGGGGGGGTGTFKKIVIELLE